MSQPWFPMHGRIQLAYAKGGSPILPLGKGDTRSTWESWLFHSYYREDIFFKLFVVGWSLTSPWRCQPWHSALMLIPIKKNSLVLIQLSELRARFEESKMDLAHLDGTSLLTMKHFGIRLRVVIWWLEL